MSRKKPTGPDNYIRIPDDLFKWWWVPIVLVLAIWLAFYVARKEGEIAAPGEGSGLIGDPF